MAVVLDRASGTRTGRWLKAMAPESALRYLPTISVLGVPLAFVVAREYERGKATFYGIPEEFVHVGPIDAIAPLVYIAGLLWLSFIVIHEVERVGIVRIASSIGASVRPLIAILFLVPFTIGVMGQFRKPQDELFTILLLLFYVLVVAGIYAVLWWLLPGIAWIGCRVVRAVTKFRATPVKQGRFGRHIFGSAFDYRFSTDLKRFFWVTLISLALIGIVPHMFGWQQARSQETYAVLAGPGKQVVLAVYDDKTFTADIDGRRIRTVRIRETTDVKDAQVTIEHLGSLRSTHGFLTAFFWSGW